MSQDQLITWIASALVGSAAAYAIGKLFNPKTASLVGPLVMLAAHQRLDAKVTSELRRALR
jgi:hypothetical protein